MKKNSPHIICSENNMYRSKILRNFWYCLSLSRDVKSYGMVQKTFYGKKFVLFRDRYNKVKCLRDYCPHRGASLSQGKLYKESSIVSCPYHGWEFDDQGILRHIPSLSTNTSSFTKIKMIDDYDIYESHGFIWMFYGSRNIPYEERSPIPFIHEFEDKNWRPIYGEIKINAPFWNTFDNAIDISHIHYLHSFGNIGKPIIYYQKDKQNKNEEGKDIFSASGELELCNNIVNPFWFWTSTDMVPVKYTIFLPLTSMILIHLGNNIKMITFVNTIPLDDTTSINRFSLLRNFAKSPIFDKLAENAMYDVFREDKAMLESLDIEKYKKTKEISVSSDRPQLQFRKLFDIWAKIGYLTEE